MQKLLPSRDPTFRHKFPGLQLAFSSPKSSGLLRKAGVNLWPGTSMGCGEAYGISHHILGRIGKPCA
jgi:hypothetical protein